MKLTGYDLERARKLRDAGLARVMEYETPWQRKAVRAITKWRGERLTGEEIRKRLEAIGVEPGHPNAWGAFFKDLVEKRLLIDTKTVKQMTSPGSHARRTPVWRVWM